MLIRSLGIENPQRFFVVLLSVANKPMETHTKKFGAWQLIAGVMACGVALLLVVGWKILGITDPLTSTGLYLGGIALCVTGIVLFVVQIEDPETQVMVNGVPLGPLFLNGHYLLAYESQTVDGKKQFRLSGLVPLDPKEEAALIRYLVLEGLVTGLWPQCVNPLRKKPAGHSWSDRDGCGRWVYGSKSAGPGFTVSYSHRSHSPIGLIRPMSSHALP